MDSVDVEFLGGLNCLVREPLHPPASSLVLGLQLPASLLHGDLIPVLMHSKHFTYLTILVPKFIFSYISIPWRKHLLELGIKPEDLHMVGKLYL